MGRLRRMATYALAVLTAFTLGLAGCASVPPETVELSHAIGNDISELQRTHRASVALHFAQARESADRFVDQTYRPALIEETARRANLIGNATAIIERDPGRLPAYLTAFLARVDPIVEAKRQELIGPIDREEEALLIEIDAAYSQILAANAVITGHLASIRDVHEAQSEALGMVGLPSLRTPIGTRLADVSDRVARLNARGDEISASIEDAGERIEQLNDAIASAFGNGNEMER